MPAPVVLPTALVSGGQFVDVVEAMPVSTGRLRLVVDSLSVPPETGATMVLVYADGTERQATVVGSGPGAGELLVDPVSR